MIKFTSLDELTVDGHKIIELPYLTVNDDIRLYYRFKVSYDVYAIRWAEGHEMFSEKYMPNCGVEVILSATVMFDGVRHWSFQSEIKENNDLETCYYLSPKDLIAIMKKIQEIEKWCADA